MSQASREMTIDEWCAQLPDCHRANRELAELRTALSASEARVKELEEALRLIADGRGICGTCGTLADGDGGGVTACDCSYPEWTPADPQVRARAALGEKE